MQPAKSKKKGIFIAILVVVVVASVAIISSRKSSVESDGDEVAQNAPLPETSNSNSAAWENLNNNQKTQASDESSGDDADTKQTTSTDTSNNSNTKVSNTAPGALYTDGTYTAVGSYRSPGGPDELSVTLTVKNDLVTDTSVKEMPGDRVSAHYQQIFADNYKQYVIGQNIDTLSLDKVSSSSLTPMGFNDAVAQIKAKARKA